MTEIPRAFDYALDIAASPSDVWRALTVPEELTRWFPLKAQVTPGPGGSMTWAWEETWDWTTRIEAWEPGRLLRLVQEYRPADGADAARVAIEFTLEARGGKTRLRIVHSGFGQGDAWDNEVDSISEGWPAELASLRLYLERHRGRDRHVGRAAVSLSAPLPTTWARLTGSRGFRLSAAAPTAGDELTVLSPTGDRWSGTVIASAPGRAVTMVVPVLDDALFRLATWRDGRGRVGVWVWLATYAGDPERARDFARRAQAELERLFPEGGES